MSIRQQVLEVLHLASTGDIGDERLGDCNSFHLLAAVRNVEVQVLAADQMNVVGRSLPDRSLRPVGTFGLVRRAWGVDFVAFSAPKMCFRRQNP